MSTVATYDEVREYVRRVQEASDREFQVHYKILWENGSAPKFEIHPGIRFFRIIHIGNQESIFCFVEKATGDLYKAATWSHPAKGARGNIRDENPPLESGHFYKGSTYHHETK